MTTKLTIANLDSSLASILPIVTAVSVCDVNGTVLPDLALRPTGGHLKLTGSNFVTGCILYVNGLPATATTVISATEVRVQMPALAVGTYSIMLFNTATVAAIWVAGIVYSAAPVWTTSSYSNSGNVVNVQLLTTGDVPLIYSLQAGSTLPTGVTLSSSGLLSGTATGITTTTTVTFTVVVVDVQNQNTPQLISLSMTFYIGKLWAWGYGASGALGLDSTVNRFSPVQVGTSDNWFLIKGGNNQTLALEKNGKLWAFGANSFGQLGDGSTLDKSSPVQIGTQTNWIDILASQFASSAIKTDGTLYAWGYGAYGTLGLNDLISRSSPVQVGALTTWAGYAASGTSVAAVKTDGSLWVWGMNQQGVLGLNSSTNYTISSPRQLGSLTNWKATTTNAGSGANNVIAVKTDGTLWSWGWGSNGALGLGDITSRSSPVQIGNLTNWYSVAFRQYNSIAIKTDGTIWTWGGNQYGQIGDGTTNYRSSPVQVGALTNWLAVSAGNYHMIAVKTDGTIWTWGRNYSGQLGYAGQSRSSPIQVGTLSLWTSVATGGDNSFVIST